MAKALPSFVAPMLAVQGQPFDSEAHYFEYKWDGIRAVALVENHEVRLMSRNGIDLTARYPGLRTLDALPPGLALDGELVAFRDGKPDFERVLSRDPSTSASVRLVAFDVLYENFDSRMELAFADRRRILERLAGHSPCPALMLSEGIEGQGRKLFKSASDQGLEGVMAKRLSSRYAAGKRNGAWVKIKRRQRVQVAIIGFIEKEGKDFQSLLVASNGIPGEAAGPLRYVGRVGGGFTDAVREELNTLLREHPRPLPLVPCGERGTWVEPGLYCTVSFAEMTTAGMLRAPVFEGILTA